MGALRGGFTGRSLVGVPWDYLRRLIALVDRQNGWQLVERPFGTAQEATAFPTGCSGCCKTAGGMPTGFETT